jgi:hypothetical protein
MPLHPELPETPHIFAVKVYTGPRIIQIFQPSGEKTGDMLSVTYDELWEGTLKIGDIIKARIENKPQTPEMEEEDGQIIALN